MGWSEDLYLFPDRLIAVANWADKQDWSRKYHIGYYHEVLGGDLGLQCGKSDDPDCMWSGAAMWTVNFGTGKS
jgi:hypothetical protein